MFFYFLNSKSWQRLRPTNVAMAAFSRKQSLEIPSASLPVRLFMLPKLRHVKLTDKISLAKWAYLHIA